MLSPSTPIVALNFGCIAGIVTEADKCSPYHELSLKTHDLCSLELKITQLTQHHQPLSGVNRYTKAENCALHFADKNIHAVLQDVHGAHTFSIGELSL